MTAASVPPDGNFLVSSGTGPSIRIYGRDGAAGVVVVHLVVPGEPSRAPQANSLRLDVYPPAAPPPPGAELTDLLGRSVLEAHTQRICLAYGLRPRTGGLSRCYLARSAGWSWRRTRPAW